VAARKTEARRLCWRLWLLYWRWRRLSKKSGESMPASESLSAFCNNVWLAAISNSLVVACGVRSPSYRFWMPNRYPARLGVVYAVSTTPRYHRRGRCSHSRLILFYVIGVGCLNGCCRHYISHMSLPAVTDGDRRKTDVTGTFVDMACDAEHARRFRHPLLLFINAARTASRWRIFCLFPTPRKIILHMININSGYYRRGAAPQCLFS